MLILVVVINLVIGDVSSQLSNFKCNDSLEFQRCSLEVNNYVIDEIQSFVFLLRPKNPFQNVEFLDDRMSGSYWSLSLAEEWFSPLETNELVFSTIVSEINDTSSSDNSSILIKHSFQKDNRKVSMAVHSSRNKLDSITNNYIDIKLYGEWDDISVSDEKPLANWTVVAPDISSLSKVKISAEGFEDSLIILTVALFILVLGGTFFLAGTLKLRKAKKESEEINQKFSSQTFPEDFSPSFHKRSHSLDSGSLENSNMKERENENKDEKDCDEPYLQNAAAETATPGPKNSKVDLHAISSLPQ